MWLMYNESRGIKKESGDDIMVLKTIGLVIILIFILGCVGKNNVYETNSGLLEIDEAKSYMVINQYLLNFATYG